MRLDIRAYDKNLMHKSYDFLMDSFHISFGPDKSKWPNGLGDYAFEKYREDIERILENKSNSSFSVYHGDELMGQIELKKLKDGCGYVSFYYLAPEYRNKGLGRQLDEFAITELKKLGCQKARLTVSEINKPGQRFYEKNGWKPLGPDPHRPFGNYHGERYLNGQQTFYFLTTELRN